MEFVWLKEIDFFPARPNPISNLAGLHEICIATKSRNLGDALALTSLPGKLKAKYPKLRITTYPRGFNPVVFSGNPHVSGVSYLPDQVWGDDCNLGSGQLIRQKESYFDLPSGSDSRPQIYLTERERKWAGEFIARRKFTDHSNKPLVVLHPWGTTHPEIASIDFWDSLVQRWSHKIRFWQVGIYRQSAVQGCEYYFFTEPARWNARRLFGILSQAKGFVGVDSGPMHVARSFDIRSCILGSNAITLYPDNMNVELGDLDRTNSQVDIYLSGLSGS